MSSAPRSLRTHIGLFGRRNVGKSSVLNALTRQQVAIVSATPGTTTDPVEKPMEFLPLGPVLFVDTAGIDDEGALGEQRIAKTKKALDRTDLALLVAEAGAWGPFEQWKRVLDAAPHLLVEAVQDGIRRNGGGLGPFFGFHDLGLQDGSSGQKQGQKSGMQQ